MEHGSAKWGNVSEICRRYCEKQYTNNLLLTQHFRMGLDGYKHKRNLNVLVVGGSGAGKSRTYAIPNIMQCNCSMVITDPKAELLRKTGGVLERNGYEVRVFDLINPETSWCYNPFAYVRDDKDVLKLINNLIRNTTPKGAQSSDPFWEKSETALLQALMLYLLHEAPPEEHFVCDERLEHRIVAIEEKNKNALQKEALLSLKEHYDMDEVSNLSGFDRRMVSVPKFCSGDCPKRGSCRYQQYLERSRDHEMFIQICNHNYLLADGYHRLQDYRPLLKDYRALIVDEAHKLPDAAKQMFGKSLCYDDIREICFYLGNEYQGPEIRKLSGTIRMVLDIIGENHRTRYGIKEEFHMTEECAMYLYEGIQTMNKIIEKLEKKIPKWIRNKLEETKSVLECFFHQDKKYVLHLKQDHDHRIILCASSRRIPQYLDQMLWSRGMGAILTSGTLKTGQGFSHIRKMTGLQRVRRVREYVADSPFEYQKNCLLYLPKNLKTCRRESQEEAEMIAGHIHSLICSTYGHTLVLFTSYHLMGNVYQMLRDEIPFPMIEVWRHSPEEITRFKQMDNAVLFAAGSCWEGVDFPGDMVSSLIIVKLPFAVPDPISEAQKKEYASLKDYIQAVIVPDMQKKLRQGFGRALRTETDTCVVSILDERAGEGGRYHEEVMCALPSCKMAKDIKDVQHFIRNRKGVEYYL